MPTNKLTDAACKAAKPRENPYKLSDGGGLYLFVTPSGAKSWRCSYRVNARQKTLTLGLYPIVALAAARKGRDDAKRSLITGIDPGESKATKSKKSLRQAYTDYWNKRHDVTDQYRHDAIQAFENHIPNDLASTPIVSVERVGLLATLTVVDQAGSTSAAKKLRTYLSLAWQHAVEVGDAVHNVPQSIRPNTAFSRRTVEHFAAVELPEVPELWRRIHMESHRVSAIACKLLAYTWVRTTELRFMRFDEVEGDLWRIPAKRMKKRRDHLVPLSRQALAIIESRRLQTDSELVFESDRGNGKPISENTILFMLYEIGYKDRMTGHGFRSIASTWANENQHNPDAIERQLAHSPDNKIRASYNRAEFLPQRTAMIQAWADWLDSFLAKPAIVSSS